MAIKWACTGLTGRECARRESRGRDNYYDVLRREGQSFSYNSTYSKKLHYVIRKTHSMQMSYCVFPMHTTALHYTIFPKTLAEVVAHYRIQELHLTLTQGQ